MSRLSNFQAGLLALVLLVGFSLGAWFKWNPFADPYVLRADFDDTSNIAKRSPVRIAGIEVGKVTGVEALPGGGGRVSMELSDEALPIKEDAELKLRPRIFLGGNFFVEVEPGTPGSPAVGDGEVIPRDQTTAAVQLTDVIGSLNSDTRADLQTAVEELSAGLDQGGAEGFNQALPSLAPALRDLAITSDAALGQKPGEDVRNGLRGSARVAGALVEDEEALKGLVTDLAVTTGALVREDGALEASIPALRDTLRVAGPALGDVNAAIPTVRVTAAEARPGVRVLGPLTTAARPALAQVRALLRPSELQGTARVLRRRAPDLFALLDRSVGVFEQGRAAAACTDEVLVPFINTDFPDPDFPANSGTVNQKLMRTFVGLAGESRLSDANQSFFHTSFVEPGTAVRPAPPPGGGVNPPPRRPDVPCETQEKPNLRAPGANVTPEGTMFPLPANFKAGSTAKRADQRAALLKGKRLVRDWHRKLGERQGKVLKQLKERVR
jgi:virulence factor Mce-like protein